jgi:hypothetical protein
VRDSSSTPKRKLTQSTLDTIVPRNTPTVDVNERIQYIGRSVPATNERVSNEWKLTDLQTAFFIWYSEERYKKVPPSNTSDIGMFRKLARLIYYLKRFVDANKSLRPVPTSTFAVREKYLIDLRTISINVQARAIEFLKRPDIAVHFKAGRQLAKEACLRKGAVWNNLKRFDDIPLDKFPPLVCKDNTTDLESKCIDRK